MNANDQGSQHRPRLLLLLAVTVGALLAMGTLPAMAQDSDMASNGFLFLDADTVQGGANLTEEEAPELSCVQNNRFGRNEEIVWRVKVFDPQTGEQMDDTMLASVQVQLPDQVADLHYGAHPRNDPLDFFWTWGWDVPEDYPTGELPYTITATANDGRTGTYEQFNVSPARLIITDEIRPVIEEEDDD